jgi:Cu+-exporting ATPase
VVLDPAGHAPSQLPETSGVATIARNCPVMVGTGKGAQAGILIRPAEALETAHKLDIIVLDKTGTITAGKPTLTDIRPTGDLTGDELLTLVAAAESSSEHPLAAAIAAGARERGLALPVAAAFDSVTGKGVQATVDGHAILVGNSRLLDDAGISTSGLDPVAAGLSAQGTTPVLAAVDGVPAGVLAVADTVKDDSARAIAALRRLGIEVVMLTGDSARTARAIAAQMGVGEVVAEVLPDHKAGEIRRLQAEGRTVGMAGDGINDAPALAAADIGLAIGTGTDVAIESADITLISGSLAGVVTAIELSRATMRNIGQNLFFALAYNAIGIPLAAGVLYPVLGIRLSPIIAAAAMAASSLSVVTNANRLRRWHPTRCPRRASSASSRISQPRPMMAPAASPALGPRPPTRCAGWQWTRPRQVTTGSPARARCGSAPRTARPPSTQPSTQAPPRPARRHAALCDGGQYDTPDPPRDREDCHDGLARGRPELGL